MNGENSEINITETFHPKSKLFPLWSNMSERRLSPTPKKITAAAAKRLPLTEAIHDY